MSAPDAPPAAPRPVSDPRALWRRAARVVLVLALALAVAGLAGRVRWTAFRDVAIGRAYEAHVVASRPHAATAIDRLGTLPSTLQESSGVAVSRTQPGVLWSHNDSGDGPVIYAVDGTGRLLATVAVSGAAARDWEDIGAGVCPALPAFQTGGPPTASCLYVADTGDNAGARQTVTVYVLAEPRLDGTHPAQAAPAQAVTVRFPGGPDDCEALAVLPDGDVLLVTKGRRGTAAIYRLRATDIARAAVSGEVLTAAYDAPTGIQLDVRIGRMVTGASFSPGGMLAVRTYDEIFFFRADPAGAAGHRWVRAGHPCFLEYDERLGEGIAFLDEDTLVLTSEGFGRHRGAIHRARCGAAAGDGAGDPGGVPPSEAVTAG